MKKIKTSLSLLSLNKQLAKNSFVVIKKNLDKETGVKSKTFLKNLSKKVLISNHFKADLLKYPLNIIFCNSLSEVQKSSKKTDSPIFIKLDNISLLETDNNLVKNSTNFVSCFSLLKKSLNTIVISKFSNI
jgi:hypothetical protein